MVVVGGGSGGLGYGRGDLTIYRVSYIRIGAVALLPPPPIHGEKQINHFLTHMPHIPPRALRP